MIRARCPEPELFARLVEGRLGRQARRRILDHAADCVPCRRQLGIAALPSIGPVRAALYGSLSPGRLAVAAAMIFVPLLLWSLNSPPSEPAARPKSVRREVRPPSAPVARALPAPAPTVRAPAAEPPRPAPSREAEPSDLVAAPLRREPDPPQAPAAPVVETRPMPPEPLAAAPRPDPEEPKAAEPESFGRLAILDPFGSLVLEGAGGRAPLLNCVVVPVDGRLTAQGRPSGFRLADGTRMQLAAGGAVSVFRNATRQCTGVTLHQGALIVESSQAQSIYLRREKASGVLEGLAGLVHLSAGPKADALLVTPISSAVVWKRQGHAGVEMAAGDSLSVDADGQDVARRPKSKPSLAKFAAWPEQPASFLFANFETDLQGLDRSIVAQGALKEGFVSAVLGPQKKKQIELALPTAAPGTGDVVVRLRLRTTAARIQCGWGSKDSRGALQAIPARSRSDSGWTTLTITLPAGDGDRHGGGGRGGGRRSSLTLTVEPPARMSPDDVVFDLDEIEITRS